MKYIDVHAHVFPDDVAPKVVEQLEGYYKMHWHGDGTFADLNKSIEEAAVDRTVIFSTATKPTQVETINNYISSLCRNNNRFIGFGTMHPDYPEIEKEITRFPSLGLKGLKLHPDFQGFNIDDPRMFPIYKAVGGAMPILIHVGDENSDFSAPRRLAVIAGSEDKIFPLYGVERGFETVAEIFASAGVKDNCRLVKTPKAHWWCEDIVWTTIAEECKKLGWK